MPAEGLDGGSEPGSAAGGEQAQLVALVESLADESTGSDPGEPTGSGQDEQADAPSPAGADGSAGDNPPGDQPTSDGDDPPDEGDHAEQPAETEVEKSDETGAADGAGEPEQADHAVEVEEADRGVVVVEGSGARSGDIKQRVRHRLSELSAAERARVHELAADSAKGGQVHDGSLLEALDALALVAAGVLPGPLRNSVSGADVVDGAGQPWDHKTTWSGSDWDPERVVSQWQTKDIEKGERLIVNVERLRHEDRAELAGELARRGLSAHVVYYPPQATG